MTSEHKRAWYNDNRVAGFMVKHGFQRVEDGEIKGHDNHIVTLQSGLLPEVTLFLSGENWEAFKAAINEEE